MIRIRLWMIAAILISGAGVFTACTSDNDDNPASDGLAEKVIGKWEVNDGILQHKASEEAPLAICNYVIPSNHYTIQCTARKDSGPDGFIIVFNYVDAQHYCQLNYGYEGNTKHAIEQISGDSKKQLATRSGSIETGKWYNVKLTVAGDSIKAWLDSELMFDEVLK